MADLPPGWTLSAALSPATEPEPAAPDDISLNTRRNWAKASDEVRTTVKWLITALAAVGAMLFAKGIVSTPALSWTDNRAQLVWALVSGALALLGIGSLITMAVRILRPTMYGLLDLPEDFRALVERHPEEYLPTGARNLAEFTRQYRRAQRGVFTSEQLLVGLTGQDLEQAKAGRAVLVHNWAVYQQAKESLLERAEYHTQIAGLSRLRLIALVASGVAAAVGGIGYVLALSAPPDATPDAGAPAKPVVAELVRVDSVDAARAWDTLGLTECQVDPAVARIPVVIASGSGASDDPYMVTTLSTGADCTAMTVPVIKEVAVLIRPAVLTVTYAPAPTPTTPRLSPSPSQPLSLTPSASPR